MIGVVFLTSIVPVVTIILVIMTELGSVGAVTPAMQVTVLTINLINMNLPAFGHLGRERGEGGHPGVGSKRLPWERAPVLGGPG